jgi:uncharacterized membrane protein YuzA (DUF378 family)
MHGTGPNLTRGLFFLIGMAGVALASGEGVTKKCRQQGGEK